MLYVQSVRLFISNFISQYCVSGIIHTISMNWGVMRTLTAYALHVVNSKRMKQEITKYRQSPVASDETCAANGVLYTYMWVAVATGSILFVLLFVVLLANCSACHNMLKKFAILKLQQQQRQQQKYGRNIACKIPDHTKPRRMTNTQSLRHAKNISYFVFNKEKNIYILLLLGYGLWGSKTENKHRNEFSFVYRINNKFQKKNAFFLLFPWLVL